jgi:inosine-uridine nucleoside N-ribohydrolase
MRLLILLLLLPVGLWAQKPIIFDSDMGPDYDDVGAITLLHAYADSGYVRILATMASTRYPGVAGVMSVFNTYFGRPSIPIGLPGADGLTLRDWQHWSDTLLAQYPHASASVDAVSLYRRVLSSQADSSVTIVTVGFLTNLADLLKSDSSGLVRRKVRLLVCMAGRFPSGYEFNVMKDAGASAYVFSHWPSPIIFSGFEIGEKILVGLPLIHDRAIHGDPVQDVFRISIPLAAEDSLGRKSWDETAVLVAVLGYAPYYRLQYGRITVAADGKDTWEDSDTPTSQAHLVEAVPPAVVQGVINKGIMHQPSQKL